MIRMTKDEFLQALKDQGADRIEDARVVCPRCGLAQSAQDLIDAGTVGANFDEVKPYWGFSCVGRFDSTKGCDWTLGGLFKIHELEVTAEDGEAFRFFRPENVPAEEKVVAS